MSEPQPPSTSLEPSATFVAILYELKIFGLKRYGHKHCVPAQTAIFGGSSYIEKKDLPVGTKCAYCGQEVYRDAQTSTNPALEQNT